MDDNSVINTDSFDKRRFKELFNESTSLQTVSKSNLLPTFLPLLADIWASLYKMKPEIRQGQVKTTLLVNQLFMKKIMIDEHFFAFRNYTRLDDVLSVIGTVKLSDKINNWIDNQIKMNADLKETLQNVQLLTSKFESDQINQMDELNEKNLQLTNLLDELIESNEESFSEYLNEAKQETLKVIQDLKSLVGGQLMGSGKAQFNKIPLRQKLALIEKMTSNKKIQEIAEWAGRFKEIAQTKQKTNVKETIERNEIVYGNNIEKLLSSELSLFKYPKTKIDFLRRFSEIKTIQYEPKNLETLGQGPIILFLDQSGSMNKVESQSKAFALALLAIARKQKREFCLVLFSTQTQIIRYEKGALNITDLLILSKAFLGGGTDFSLSLKVGMTIIDSSRYKKADIIFITDGEGNLKQNILESFLKKKEKSDFQVLTLLIGNNAHIVKLFSNQVIKISDLSEDASFAAFEI